MIGTSHESSATHVTACGRPPRTRAPHVGKGDVVQAGLLARGSLPSFRLPGPKSPVASGGGLAADSCGGSSGFGHEKSSPHRIPFWPTLAGTPAPVSNQRRGRLAVNVNRAYREKQIFPVTMATQSRPELPGQTWSKFRSPN